MTRGLPPAGSPLRLRIRDARGPSRRSGDVEVTTVARVYEAGLDAGRVGIGASLARPHRVEVHRDGVPQGSLRIADWNLRIAIAALLASGALWLIERNGRGR